MTVYTLQAAMPPADLAAGMIMRLEAISPTTGAAVAGVKATAWAIYGVDISDTLESIENIIPGYTPEEVTGIKT